MKNTIQKSYGMKNRIAITLGVAVIMFATIFSIVNYIYTKTVEQCYENLSAQTTLIKSEIFMRMEADTEQLKTIANFSSPVFEKDSVRDMFSSIAANEFDLSDTVNIYREFQPVFDSFQKNGLIDEIEILIPGDILINSTGAYEIGQDDIFNNTISKGVHISNVRSSFLENKKVIHNAVPIIINGEPVAVLMGVVEVSKLGSIYSNLLKYEGSHLHLVEGETGAFMVNSEGVTKGNVSGIAASESAIEKFVRALQSGGKGKLGYRSLENGKFIFVGYDSVGINDWRIVVAMPENIVFDDARKNIAIIVILSAVLVVLMVAYAWLSLMDSRKRLRLTYASSFVRKLLLESGKRSESFGEALKQITKSVRARSSFFVDTDGEFYGHIDEKYNEVALDGAERSRLVKQLVDYSDNMKREIFVKSIVLNASLEKSNPEIYALMKEHEINNIVFTVIWDKDNHAGLLGVINSKRALEAPMLLADVAMCFSMTVYSRKHLIATEHAAVTDSLTGLTNRMGFNNDITGLRMKKINSLSCLYIDVNELHAHNNKYGHLSGDKMLVTIADIIKRAFSEHKGCRWGGDEFIVFAENISRDHVEDKIETIKAQTKSKNYHISVGFAYTDKSMDIESLLNEAEKNMYEAKARYYQEKSKKVVPAAKAATTVEHIITGNSDLDAALAVMAYRYTGIYAVNLDDDTARIVFILKAFDILLEKEKYFSKAMEAFIDNNVDPDYHREFASFMNYDILKSNLADGIRPRMVYRRVTGEQIVVTVYPHNNMDNSAETLWVFES